MKFRHTPRATRNGAGKVYQQFINKRLVDAAAKHAVVVRLKGGASRDLPVMVVENASLPESRRISVTLEELPRISQYGLNGPTVIILGRIFAAALAAAEPTHQSACKTA